MKNFLRVSSIPLNAFIVALAICTNQYLICAVVLIWADFMIYLLLDIKNSVMSIAFAITFFTFLMGRQISDRFGLHAIENPFVSFSFSESENLHAETLVLISLICLWVGSIIFKKKFVDAKDRVQLNFDKSKYVRQAAKILFFICLPFALVNYYVLSTSVLSGGYISTYVEGFSSGIPSYVGKIGEFAQVAFIVYLAGMPTKRDFNRTLPFYLLYLVFTLGDGRRFAFLSGIILIAVYLYIRNTVRSGGVVWFGKKTLFAFAIIGPILMVLMIIMAGLRAGYDATKNPDNPLIRFFYTQGFSINLIKFADYYKSDLPENRFYSFFSSTTFFQNILSPIIGFQPYSGHNVRNALEGFSLDHALTYRAYGEDIYLGGAGMGSTYIAEVFHDFGYIGVIAVNLLYSYILRKIDSINGNNIWKTSVLLFVFVSMLFISRAGADSFLTSVINLTTLTALFIIFMISKFKINFIKSYK